MAKISVAGADTVVCAVCGVAADAVADGDAGRRCRGGCMVLDLAAISGVRGASSLPSQESVVGVPRADRRGIVVDGSEDDP